jgi:hypothetical protein
MRIKRKKVTKRRKNKSFSFNGGISTLRRYNTIAPLRKTRKTPPAIASGFFSRCRKTRKVKKGGYTNLKTVKILVKPSVLSNSQSKRLVSQISVSDTGTDVDELLADIIHSRVKSNIPYYRKDIKVET